MSNKYISEPFRIKMVEPIKIFTHEECEKTIAEARNNHLVLKEECVYCPTHQQWH